MRKLWKRNIGRIKRLFLLLCEIEGDQNTSNAIEYVGAGSSNHFFDVDRTSVMTEEGL